MCIGVADRKMASAEYISGGQIRAAGDELGMYIWSFQMQKRGMSELSFDELMDHIFSESK
ncbi:hypothetical protein SAMN02910369_01416 [Lachnospiraceae bacterium NE2001]|nr:hypothetical protein SAMN02910369_01416 [Lachnospiraceae bacterium NE2001]